MLCTVIISLEMNRPGLIDYLQKVINAEYLNSSWFTMVIVGKIAFHGKIII